MKKPTEVKKTDYTVASAFVWDGVVRLPKKKISLTEAQAKPLLNRGKIEKPKPASKAAAAKTEGGKD